MAFIIPLIGAGLTPLIGAGAAGVASQIIPGLAFSAIGLLFADKPPDPMGGRIPIQQDTPPRGYAYGRERVAGSILLAENVGGDLIYIVALVSHASLDGGTEGGFQAGFEEYYLDDRKVLVTDGENHIVNGIGGGVYGGDSILFYWRHGDVPSEPYAGGADITGSLEENFMGTGGLDETGVWTVDHRADGITTLLMLCDAPKPEKFALYFPNGKPTPSVVGRWRVLFDHRDIDQDPDDETTWVYSENLALQIMHLLCWNEFTAEYDYHKSIEPDIDWWDAQADICDEAVALAAGGTELRYSGGGFATTADKPAVTLQKMLQACDGMIFVRGDGTVRLTAGKFQWNGATITDDDIIGFNIQNGVADEEAVNTLNGRFVSPPHGYGAVECDPYGTEAFTVERAYLRPSTMDVPWVKSFTHCRRLMKREVFRLNQNKRGTFDLKLSALNCAYERWIKIVSTRFPALDGTYIENRRPTLSPMSARIRIEWGHAGNGEDIELWDEDTDEGAAPPVPSRYDTVGPDIPANVAAEAQEFLTGESTKAIRIEVSFDEPNDLHFYRIRWRVQDGPGLWHDSVHEEDALIDAGRLYLETEAVTRGTILEVQAATLTGKGILSEWSDAVEVDTTLAAPLLPTDLAIALQSNVPRPRWTNGNSIRMDHANVYRVATGGGSGSAIDVSGDLPGSANQDMHFLDTSATAGTWDYYVTVSNATGVESTFVGPVIVTVLV